MSQKVNAFGSPTGYAASTRSSVIGLPQSATFVRFPNRQKVSMCAYEFGARLKRSMSVSRTPG
jgi:hypothetical protein